MCLFSLAVRIRSHHRLIIDHINIFAIVSDLNVSIWYTFVV